MSLKLDSSLAKAADSIASGIKESGQYIGTITRAERLVSEKGTIGLGLSIKTADGQTADYLDLWHTKADGTVLSSAKTVNAIMCCVKVADAEDGRIQCEKWNPETQRREIVAADGYPALMGKRVGLLLQQVLETNNKGKDVSRLNVFAVFNAETGMTASEMYAKAEKPERLGKMLEALNARPVVDKRSSGGASHAQASNESQGFADQDIPF